MKNATKFLKLISETYLYTIPRDNLAIGLKMSPYFDNYQFNVVADLIRNYPRLDFLTCISAAASSISNVGPGLGEIIGPDGNYSSLTNYSKLILILTMFLGRLEMLTIFVLLLPSFWKN